MAAHCRFTMLMLHRIPIASRLCTSGATTLRGYSSVCHRSVKDTRWATIVRSYSSNFDKSEVVKDIVLYRNTGQLFFRVVGAFACAQLFFWGYLTHTAFTTMRDSHIVQVTKYGSEGAPPAMKNWKSWSGIHLSLTSGRWRYGVTLLCLGAGGTIFVAAFMYSRRSISRLILRKGGQMVTVETFGFLGLRSSLTVPVRHTSCSHSRHVVASQLPIKVFGRSFHFILDKQGKFLNGRLFDYTAGMKRVFV